LDAKRATVFVRHSAANHRGRQSGTTNSCYYYHNYNDTNYNFLEVGVDFSFLTRKFSCLDAKRATVFVRHSAANHRGRQSGTTNSCYYHHNYNDTNYNFLEVGVDFSLLKRIFFCLDAKCATVFVRHPAQIITVLHQVILILLLLL